MEKIYAVGCVKKEHDVNVFGREQTLPLIWADGMIGVIPVFKTKADAEIYADGKADIFTVYIKKAAE